MKHCLHFLHIYIHHMNNHSISSSSSTMIKQLYTKLNDKATELFHSNSYRPIKVLPQHPDSQLLVEGGIDKDEIRIDSVLKERNTSVNMTPEPCSSLYQDSKMSEEPDSSDQVSNLRHLAKSRKNSMKELTSERKQIVNATNNMETYLKCLFHDFRGPLNNILLATNLLEDDIDSTHPLYLYLKILKNLVIF
jgi:signal transduction histidine kinase